MMQIVSTMDTNESLKRDGHDAKSKMYLKCMYNVIDVNLKRDR